MVDQSVSRRDLVSIYLVSSLNVARSEIIRLNIYVHTINRVCNVSPNVYHISRVR